MSRMTHWINNLKNIDKYRPFVDPTQWPHGVSFVWRLLYAVSTRYVKERYTYRASALTYTSLLAAVPLFAVVFSLLSAFPIFGGVSDKIQHLIFNNFVPATGEVVKEYLHNFAQNAMKLSAFGLAFLFVTSIMLLVTIERAFNDIWHNKNIRRGMGAFLRYWAILSLSPLFVGLSFAVSSYVFSLSFVSSAVTHFAWVRALGTMVPFFLVMLGFTMLYALVPNCKVYLRHALVGGGIAALLFEFAKRGFAYYVVMFPKYKLIYGAMATIPLFLIWVYISWLIILLGALITHALSQEKIGRRNIRLDGFTHAYLWLGVLWQAQEKGEELTQRKLIRACGGRFDIMPEDMLHMLVKKRWISRTERGAYVINRNFTHQTIQDLYNDFSWQLPSASALEQLKDDKLAKGLHQCLEQTDACYANALNISLASSYSS